MLARVRPRLTYANVVASLALFVALGGGAYAARSFVGSDGRIHACVGKKGHLTLVKPGSKCGKGTSHLAWNKRGPSGRQGPGLKQFEFNSIPTDGKTYPMAPPVAGIQVKARCDASMLYIDLDTASGQTMHISGIVEHDNDTSADNPVGTITPPRRIRRHELWRLYGDRRVVSVLQVDGFQRLGRPLFGSLPLLGHDHAALLAPAPDVDNARRSRRGDQLIASRDSGGPAASRGKRQWRRDGRCRARTCDLLLVRRGRRLPLVAAGC